MTNKEKYENVFKDTFKVNENQLEELEYQSIQAWDSVGHMGLVASLEDAFNIQFEADDIIDFNSFKKGIELLKKYNISI